MAVLCGLTPLASQCRPPLAKEVIDLFVWLSTNWINIVLVVALVLIVTLLIRGIIHNKKAGKSSCGGNCASCGACGGCSTCGKCAAMNDVQTKR